MDFEAGVTRSNQSLLPFVAMALIVNVTAKEYFVDGTESAVFLKDLLSKNTSTTALLVSDVGESRWNRTDKIVMIQDMTTVMYVRSQYSQLLV